MSKHTNWWKNSTIYQIYPQSFNDTNNDGIGDLQGIIEKIPYLKELGISAVWLNPIYESPLVDNGYDIANYEKINPIYGTMADFDAMVTQLHQAGIKVIMDLVVNHTSDQHAWFQESRKSKHNPYSDYYIWKDPAADGGQPNNWGSMFGGPAWEYVPERGQYYLHLFAKEQPDLNWDNPQLRQSVYDMMRFWLDKGVDGFRMDTINLISKFPEFDDGPIIDNKEYASAYPGVANGPHLHEYLHEMYEQVLQNYDTMTVGETPHTSAKEAQLFSDPARQELDMIFQFEHMHVDYGENGRYSDVGFKLSDLRESMVKWQYALAGKGWNSLYLNNHDQPRLVSRFGDDETYRKASAKMLALLLHFQKGTPYVYQGEELGMTNVDFDDLADFPDIESKNNFARLKKLGYPKAEIMKIMRMKSRDNARTPMQWDSSENAGFTQGKPWIRVNDNYRTINVAAAMQDSGSIFNFYRQLIELRKTLPIMEKGTFEQIEDHDSSVFSYLRHYDNQTLLVIGSFADQRIRYQIPAALRNKKRQLLLSTYNQDDGDLTGSSASVPDETIYLRPYEGVVYIIND